MNGILWRKTTLFVDPACDVGVVRVQGHLGVELPLNQPKNSRHQVRFGTLQDRELKLCDPFGKVCGNWDWHKKWICMVHVACNNEAVSIFRTCLDIQQLSSAFQRIVLIVLFLWWSFESIDQCHYESKGLFYYHHITCISKSHGHC